MNQYYIKYSIIGEPYNQMYFDYIDVVPSSNAELTLRNIVNIVLKRGKKEHLKLEDINIILLTKLN